MAPKSETCRGGSKESALLAGLGVGGLALAIAAQDTVANIFGGATIFADRPFQINERIRIGGFDGYVRDIGLRSTRIATLAGPVVQIPNSTFTTSRSRTSPPRRRCGSS